MNPFWVLKYVVMGWGGSDVWPTQVSGTVVMPCDTDVRSYHIALLYAIGSGVTIRRHCVPACQHDLLCLQDGGPAP